MHFKSYELTYKKQQIAKQFVQLLKTDINMATVKTKFRPSTVNGKEGVIYYQVIHNRTARQLKTSYHLYAHEWSTA